MYLRIYLGGIKLKDLTNLALKRNWKQAILFYIAYLVLGFLIAGLLGGLTGVIDPDNVEESAEIVGYVAGSIYISVLYFTIYIKKKLNSFLLIILGVITAVINLFFGNIVSMIIVAILTTLDNKSEEEASNEDDPLSYSKDK